VSNGQPTGGSNCCGFRALESLISHRDNSGAAQHRTQLLGVENAGRTAGFPRAMGCREGHPI